MVRAMLTGARERVRRKAGDALWQAGGDEPEARGLLWCWARDDTALREDLVRVACQDAIWPV